MRVQRAFLDGLAKQGFPQSEIRFLDAEKVLESVIGQTSLNEFSKKHNVNSGSLSAMVRGKRAIPLTLLRTIPKNCRWALKNGNIPVMIPTDITEELGYLVGLLRDGTVTKESNGEYSCAFYSINLRFLRK